MNFRRAASCLVGVFLMLCLCLFAWGRQGRHPPRQPVDSRVARICSFGRDCGDGNLLGIQPYMIPADYASEARFHAKLDGYLAQARKRGLIGAKTVVVFPEYLGVWLVAAGEKEAVYEASTVQDATTILVASNLPAFMRWVPFANVPERARCALFLMKARSMAASYQRTFSRLARAYRVTIVAGSIFLPGPRVTDGALLPGRGPLYNVCAVFGPEGRIRAPLVRKAFPTAEEKRYMSAGAVEEVPVFDTPAGRLGVLICADSWYPQSYRVLRKAGVDMIAVPSYLYPAGRWDEKWAGYSGARTPGDVKPGDEHSITEGEAWMRYALAGRISRSAARAGINVFLRGRLWDLGSDGQAVAVLCSRTYACPRINGAVVANVWLYGRSMLRPYCSD